MSDKVPAPPPPLPQPIKLLVALAALSATNSPPQPPVDRAAKWYSAIASTWLKGVCKHLEIDPGNLPPSIPPEAVKESAADQVGDWSEEDRTRIAGILVEASLASGAEEEKGGKATKSGDKEDPKLAYRPIERALSHRTLVLLGLDAKALLPVSEATLSETLFKALKAAEDSSQKEKVDKAREAQSQGWGGAFGRHLATGAGVIAGGVLIGVTGGLAAPAIAALLAPLGIGGILAGGAAPVVLGTLFGVGGGGLAGKRVGERWRGVEEFAFVEVGAGTRVTVEEMDDLREARNRQKMKEEEERKEKEAQEKETLEGEAGATGKDAAKEEQQEQEGGAITDEEAAAAVDNNQRLLEEKLLSLSLNSGADQSSSRRSSVDSPRPSLDNPAPEEAVADKKKPPSLTVSVHSKIRLTKGHNRCTRSAYGVQDRSDHCLARDLLEQA